MEHMSKQTVISVLLKMTIIYLLLFLYILAPNRSILKRVIQEKIRMWLISGMQKLKLPLW